MIARLLLLLLSTQLLAAGQGSIDFKADYYTRDLSQNLIVGKGNAWLKKDDKEVWADELEFDFNTNKAIARGNVRVIDGGMEINARYASYNLNGKEALLEEATLTVNQAVLAGSVIRKIDEDSFSIEHGSFSNCNIRGLRGNELTQCDFDWKVYGSSINLTFEDYVHVHDAILYVKSLPVMYLPYIVLPIKSKRQSGVLMPTFTYTAQLGTGTTVPVFFAFDRWHDLTLWPTYYNKNGFMEFYNRAQYRYVYSTKHEGNFQIATTTRRFSANRITPGTDDPTRGRTLGFIGEWMVDFNNRFAFAGRARSRQLLHLVSDPYWGTDFSDLPPEAALGYLRSHISYSLPSDQYLFAGQIQHHQSLIIPEDSQSDRGAVTRLPDLYFSKSDATLWSRYFSYEINTRFTNYFRGAPSYDQVPVTPVTSGAQTDGTGYEANDYIRTGRRFILEPKLVANVPMPNGLQLNPNLKAGALLYHFDAGPSSTIARGYVQAEIPFSIYLSKQFETSIPGFEKVSHVLQPRVIYGTNLYQDRDEEDATFQTEYPFFYRDLQFSNPRFDILDQITPFQYVRFELINRFRRQTPTTNERFFFLKVSEQYNIRRFANDPRYSKQVGPLEIISELRLWRFIAQLQGTYQLELTNGVRESDWSGAINYASPEGDQITTNILLRNRADRALTEETITLVGTKVLPFFFDLKGGLEYSAKRGELVSYSLGLAFASKPRSCWRLDVVTGRDTFRRPFASVRFHLDFGGTTGLPL